jgi:flagellar M-ring protein FliF
VAVLINKASLTASLGDKPAPDALSKQVQEIEQLVTTAAGLRKDRGDLVKIAVVDFAADSGRDLAPVEPPSLLETLARQAGSFVSSGAIVLVALLLLWFGLRPATRMLLAPPAESASAFAGGLSELPPPMSALESLGPGGPAMALGNLGGSDQNFLIDANDERDDFLKELVARKDKSPQRHLQKLVDFDEEVAAAILKQWIREGANA